MTRDRRQRLLYAALAVVFGLPSLVLGGAIAVIGIWVGSKYIAAEGLSALGIVLVLWGLAGILAALMMLGYSLWGLGSGEYWLGQVPFLLLLGPSMLIPAAMLYWIRCQR